jgi:hypothetical protein
LWSLDRLGHLGEWENHATMHTGLTG